MCVCMCAVVWCVVYTHEQMLHSFNPARCHQLFSRQTSMVCSGAPAFKGLSCFLIAYDCRSFRWLTHTIQLHANSVTVPSTGYVMCRHKERNTKRKIWNRKEVIFSIILMLQWSDSSGILLWDQIVSVSFLFRILSGETLTQHTIYSIPSVDFRIKKDILTIVHTRPSDMKRNERKTTPAASTHMHSGQRVMRPKSSTASLFEILLYHYRLSCVSFGFRFYFHMCDEDINMSTKIESKCVCVWLDIIGILSL